MYLESVYHNLEHETCNTGDEPAEELLVEYEVQPSSTGVCITCTFMNGSLLQDCVAVVHQRISSSAGLMNIESSHKFTRSGDTASGCIEGVNLEDYQVGVMGGNKIISPADQIDGNKLSN